jgi:hypothetical protein
MPVNLNIIPGTSIAIKPSGYKLIKVELTNHENRKIDITNLTTSFQIIESIYQTYSRLKLNIKDNIGLLEEYEISGQEKIRVVFEKTDKYIGTVRIDKTFYSTEYPDYMKSPGPRIQVYSFVGVSEFAFLSQFKKISRSVNGEIKEIIRDIFIKDLHVDPSRIVMTPIESPKIRAIIPNFFPIKAIHWLLRRCFDPLPKGRAPFYVYETLDSKIHIDSHYDMITRGVYRDYKEGRNYTKDPEFEEDEDYWQRLIRMIQINSDIKLTKFLPGTAGAYASTTEYLDQSIKTYSKEDFNYNDEFEKMTWLDKYKTVSTLFQIESEGKRLYELPDVYTNRISLNYEAYNLNDMNYHNPTGGKTLNRVICYEEQFDALVHDVTVHGDPTIMSGLKLNLHFNQPVDPELAREGYENNINHMVDRFITGDYIITSVEHNFDGEYFQKFRVKKDSYSEPLED